MANSCLYSTFDIPLFINDVQLDRKAPSGFTTKLATVPISVKLNASSRAYE